MRVGILTVSDRSYKGLREDISGPALVQAAGEYGWTVAWADLLPDEQPEIQAFLKAKCDAGKTDILFTTGGTGFAPRDVTPEATSAIIERPAPGLSEAIRAASIKITPHAMLARGVAGIRGRTLIVNLSGSPKAALEQLAVVAPALPHAVQLLRENPDSEIGHQKVIQ